MSKKSDTKPENIKPVDKAETTQTRDRTQLAIGIQTAVNVVQRQVFTSRGMGKLYKSNIEPSSLANGLVWRFLYQPVAIYPTLTFRKVLTGKTDASPFAVNFLTATSETVLGIMLEVSSYSKNLKSVSGVNITKKDLFNASKMAAPAALLRNFCGWWSINKNTDQDNIFTKVVYGAGSGGLSTPFNNISIKFAVNSVGKTAEETYQITKKEIISQPEILFRGAVPRAISIAAASVILWPKTTEFIEKKCDEVFDYIDKKPSSSPKGISAAKAKRIVNEKEDGKS